MWVVSDDALLDGLATGDPDATAAFIERFQRRVFGVALRIVNDPRLAGGRRPGDVPAGVAAVLGVRSLDAGPSARGC